MMRLFSVSCSLITECLILTELVNKVAQETATLENFLLALPHLVNN